MATVLAPTPTPDLVALLAADRLAPAGPAPLTVVELDDAVTAILDREDVAGPDERARLRRVRSMLEHELADRLAE